ncbi:MAG: hypothetical protein HQL97_09360 [Magnetococcales bacterium]|nr:hypothetical protein [Magnetococcales bacterium]
MNLEERIKVLNSDHFTDSAQKIVLKEDEPGGSCTLELRVTRRCLALHKADERKIGFLKNQQVADCIVIELEEGNAYALHVFELKKTIRRASWEKILSQFEGAFHNALGLLGVLGLATPERIVFHAAYCNNQLDSAPGLRKIPSGSNPSQDQRELNGWQQGRIDVSWLKGAPLKKVQWDWNKTHELHIP